MTTQTSNPERVLIEGNVFVRGDICGFGKPDYKPYAMTAENEWYWQDGIAREKKQYLRHKWLEKEKYEVL